MKKYINLGIFAHIDAGKTTLTENILLESNLTKDLGKVDKQTSHVDTMDLERSMGITIQSTSVRIELENAVINLMDTPGHTDFYSEVERVIPAIQPGAVQRRGPLFLDDPTGGKEPFRFLPPCLSPLYSEVTF